MAAPTNVRVESTSFDSATLYWVGGVGTITIYRSTDGISFSPIDTTPATDLTYIDTTVDDGTLYYYKLSDDGGSTFSSVVSVVIQTCNNTLTTVRSSGTLPRAEGEVTSSDFNDAMTILETNQRTVEAPDNCRACSENGTLVLDYGACPCYDVYVTENINSIVMIGCDDKRNACLNLIIPENQSFTVCGFIPALGFDGTNQGCSNVLTGGPGGSRYQFSFTQCLVDANSGLGGPANIAPLTLDCEQTDTGAVGCQIKCDADPGLNDHRVVLNAHGGVPFVGSDGSYSWTTTSGLLWITTGSRLLCQAGATTLPHSNPSVTWAPCPDRNCPGAPNPSQDALLAAYSFWNYFNGTGLVPDCCGAASIRSEFSCGGVFGACTNQASDPSYPTCSIGTSITCSSDPSCLIAQTHGQAGFEPAVGFGVPCATCGIIAGKMVDQRTPTMKANGCCPCKLGAGAVITVTDSIGQSVAVTIVDVGA